MLIIRVFIALRVGVETLAIRQGNAKLIFGKI